MARCGSSRSRHHARPASGPFSPERAAAVSPASASSTGRPLPLRLPAGVQQLPLEPLGGPEAVFSPPVAAWPGMTTRWPSSSPPGDCSPQRIRSGLRRPLTPPPRSGFSSRWSTRPVATKKERCRLLLGDAPRVSSVRLATGHPPIEQQPGHRIAPAVTPRRPKVTISPPPPAPRVGGSRPPGPRWRYFDGPELEPPAVPSLYWRLPSSLAARVNG